LVIIFGEMVRLVNSLNQLRLALVWYEFILDKSKGRRDSKEIFEVLDLPDKEKFPTTFPSQGGKKTWNYLKIWTFPMRQMANQFWPY